MELHIQTQELAPIQANLAQIKEYVGGVVAKYQGATYSDDQIKLAKADRADLKRLKEDIETKRKAVKAKWNEPYLAFETEIKSITALIDEPVMLIDGQIKDFEARRKQERYSHLEEIFNTHNTLGPLLSFEQVVETSWLNVSTAQGKAVRLLVEKMETITRNVAQLESIIGPENRTVCIDHYLKTLNLADAIMKDTLLKAEKAKQEAILGVAEPVQEAKPEPLPEEDIFADIPLSDPQDYPETRRFIVTGTPAQISKLRQWANEQHIKMREVF